MDNKSNSLSQAGTLMVPVEVQDELKDITLHNNFSMFVCLKAEWYCSFLLLVFRATAQALESPGILCAELCRMDMSTCPPQCPSQCPPQCHLPGWAPQLMST